MFMEFETPKGEKVCVNVSCISFFCEKRKHTTLISIGDYVEIEVNGTYESISKRFQNRDILFASPVCEY